MSADPLARVRRAYKTKQKARRELTRAVAEYRQAVDAARAAGHSYADIGRALGISRQAVRQLNG